MAASASPLASQIDEARSQGYGDDEVLGHLAQTRSDLSPKIQEAKAHGYGAAEVLSHLRSINESPAPDPYQQKSALGKFGSGLNDTTVGPLVNTAKTLMDAGPPPTNPVEAGWQLLTQIPRAAGKIAGGMVGAQVDQFKRAGSDLGAAWQQGKQGHYRDAAQLAGSGVAHGLAGATPVLGPLEASIADTATGNITPGQVADPAKADPARALGMTAGVAATALAPKMAKGAANAVDPALLRQSAVEQYGRVLAPTTRENKILTSRVAPELLNRGVTAMTRKGLAEKIGAQVTQAGQAIDSAIGNLPPNASLPAQAIYKAIDDARDAKFTIQNPKTGTPMAASPDMQSRIDFANQLKGIVKAGETVDGQGNPVIDSRYLRELRQNWDTTVAESGGFTTNDLVNSAKLAAYRASSGALREQFAQAYPDIDALNKEYAFWRNSQKVIDATVQRKMGQAKPLGEQIAENAGMVMGGVNAGVHGAVYGRILGSKMIQLMRSPAWQTLSAVTKNKMADLLAKGNVTGVNKVAVDILSKTGVGAVLAGESQQKTIPEFAHGGVVHKRTLAVIGEAGPELRMPLSAALRTIPEKPETLKLQLAQLEQGKRKAVMFPKGSPLQKKPKGMQSFADEHGNTFIYNPQLTSGLKIHAAVKANKVTELLGATHGGMGAPDKTKVEGPGVAVTAKSANGTAAQTSVTDPKDLKRTTEQTKKITPAGGKVVVEDPRKEAARRSASVQSGQDIIRGSSDIPLSQKGLEQADELGRQFERKGGLDAIATSDLKRANQTADALALRTGANIVERTKALHPWHLGEIEGQPTEKVLGRMNDLIQKHPDQKVPGRGPQSSHDGESFNSFTHRALPYIHEVLKEHDQKHPESRIGLVTHYRVVRLVEAWLKAGAPSDYRIDSVHMAGKGDPPGSVHRLFLDQHKQPRAERVDMASAEKNKPGVFLIRHGVTKWNAENGSVEQALASPEPAA